MVALGEKEKAEGSERSILSANLATEL